MEVCVQISKEIQESEVVNLYRENGWSSAQCPDKLIPALLNSDTLVTARVNNELVGLGNAILRDPLINPPVHSHLLRAAQLEPWPLLRGIE